MTKAYKVYNDEVAIPVYQDSQPDILVNIPGLRHQPLGSHVARQVSHGRQPAVAVDDVTFSADRALSSCSP